MKTYGPRSSEHQKILDIPTEKALQKAYPWVDEVKFHPQAKTFHQSKMGAKQIKDMQHDVIAIHKFSAIVSKRTSDAGGQAEGDVYNYLIGDKNGQVVPKMLIKTFQTLERGTIGANLLTTECSDEEMEKLYVITRLAQLRGYEACIREEDHEGPAGSSPAKKAKH